MLREFYDRELLPLAGTTLDRGADHFIKKLDVMDNKERVSTNELIRRVADMEIGQEIHRRLDNEVDNLIGEIASRYEDIGERYSEFYKVNAQRVNLWVSIALALVLNVNVITIFQTVGGNQDVQSAIVKEAMVLVESQTPEDNSPDSIEAQKQEMRNLLDEVEKLGIPYGWPILEKPIEVKNEFLGLKSYFYTVKTSITKGLSDFSLGWGIWIITTIFTGCLIGLGASFWFDIIKRLVVVNRFATALFGATTKQKAANDNLVNEETPQAVFRKAIKGKEAADTFIHQMHAKPINPNIKL